MKKNRSRKVDSRKLRFETMEERLPLSVSPLFTDSDIIPWPLPEFHLEELIEELESAQEVAIPYSHYPQKEIDYEKLEQLREEGKVTKLVEYVTESGEIITIPCISKEYMEAMGPIVPYMTMVDSPVNELNPDSEDGDEREGPLFDRLNGSLAGYESDICSNPITDFFYIPKIKWTEKDFESPEDVYTTLDTIHFIPRYPSLDDAIKYGQNEPQAEWNTNGQPSAYPSYNTSVASNYESYTHLNDVRNSYGVTGKGQTVVVIDTGIFANHVAFRNSQGGHRIIDWKDFVYSNTTPMDTGFHGTHVSGIIASSDPNCFGIAPNVNLVVLQVFDTQGRVSSTNLRAALQWVIDNKSDPKFNSAPITAINMSLGFDTAIMFADSEMSQLRNAGIFISCAAGNGFSDPAYMGGHLTKVDYPSSSGYSVAVSAFTNTNGLLDNQYSQRNSTVLVAPGTMINSAVPNNYGSGATNQHYGVASGTSMATPYVTGSATLLYEAIVAMEGVQAVGGTNVAGLQNRIYNMMFNSNNCDRIYDSVTSQYYSRLNLKKAFDNYTKSIDTITLDPGNTTSTPRALSNLNNSSPQDVTGYFSSLTDKDYYRFTASQTGNIRINRSLLTNTDIETEWDKSLLSGATGDDSSLYFSVTAGSTYTFGIKCRSGKEGLGKYELKIGYIPTTPTGLTATSVNNTSNQIQLTWNATPGATRYTVQRSTTGTGGWTTLSTNVTAASYLNSTNLSANTPYYYRIRAHNSIGPSDYTSVISATTNPATPTGFTATAVANYSNRIQLTWNAVSGATSYTIQRSLTGTNSWTTVTSATTGTAFTNSSGLSANTTYDYRILAKNSGGSSAYSSIVTAKTNPAAPTGVAAFIVSNSQTNVTWNAVSGAASYTIQCSYNAGRTWETLVANVTTTSYSIMAPTTGTGIHYRVFATNSSRGTSPYSAVVTPTYLKAETNLVVRNNGATIPAGASITDLDLLQGRKTWSHEWDSFTVEIWGNSKHVSEALKTFSCELLYDPNLYEPRLTGSITAGANWTLTSQFTTGKIALSGTTTLTSIGKNTNALLVQIEFVPSSGDGVFVPQIGYAIPESSGFNISSNIQYGYRNSSTGYTQTVTSNINGLANLPIYPVLYDLDDSNEIDLFDFTDFSIAFNSLVGDPLTSSLARFDFNHDGCIDLFDHTHFSIAFGKQKGPDVTVSFPDNFPNAWPQLSGPSGSPAVGTPIIEDNSVNAPVAHDSVDMQFLRDFHLQMLKEALAIKRTDIFDQLTQGALFDLLFSSDNSWVPAFKAQWTPKDGLTVLQESPQNRTFVDGNLAWDIAEINMYYDGERNKGTTNTVDVILAENTFQSDSIVDQLISEQGFVEEMFLPFESWHFAPLEESLPSQILA